MKLPNIGLAVIVVFVAFAGMTINFVLAAAELTPVTAPPADWLGVGVVAGIAAVSVAIVGYALFLRRPGLQPGEEAINKLLDLIKKKEEVIAAQAVVIATTAPAAVASAPVPAATPFVNEKYLLTIPGDGSAPTIVRAQI